MRLGSCIAAAPIRPLARELSYDADLAVKEKKKNHWVCASYGCILWHVWRKKICFHSWTIKQFLGKKMIFVMRSVAFTHTVTCPCFAVLSPWLLPRGRNTLWRNLSALRVPWPRSWVWHSRRLLCESGQGLPLPHPEALAVQRWFKKKKKMRPPQGTSLPL